MNDEQTDEALKADESQIEVESPATKTLPTESVEEKVEEVSTEVETTEGTPKDEGRKTAESRIRELVAEKKEAERKAESLADQVRKFTAPQPPTYTPPAAETETELTVDEVLKRADALTQIRLAQQDNIHRVQQEAVEAAKAHPELDTESASFDSELSEAVSKATLAYIQSNPTGSVKDFVNGLMKPYKRAVEKEASGQAEIRTKQISQQAVRPTQVQEQEKPFSELSLEEMEKRLGKVWR
jgi:hypothetical protein